MLSKSPFEGLEESRWFPAVLAFEIAVVLVCLYALFAMPFG